MTTEKNYEDREAESAKFEGSSVPQPIKDYILRHSRPIGFVCVITFLLLLLFVGFAFGAAYICEGQMAGILDDRFTCHILPEQTNKWPSPTPGDPQNIGGIEWHYPLT